MDKIQNIQEIEKFRKHLAFWTKEINNDIETEKYSLLKDDIQSLNYWFTQFEKERIKEKIIELMTQREYLINEAEYNGDLSSCQVEKAINEINKKIEVLTK